MEIIHGYLNTFHATAIAELLSLAYPPIPTLPTGILSGLQPGMIYAFAEI